MLSKKLWLPALMASAAFTFGIPSVVSAQSMGGGDEKKDEPKADEPAKPAEGGDKKPDEPKPDAAKKTLAFEKPDSFKEEKAHGKLLKHLFKLDAVEGEQDAAVSVIFVGTGADYGKEKDRWVKAFKDKDGKTLDTSAVKEEAFESNGVKGKIAEVAGMFTPRARGGKGGKGGEGGAKGEDGGDAKAEAKWTRVVNIYLEGPDGGWILRIQGGDKTVEKFRADFMKYAKSVKIVDGSADDNKPKKDKKKANE